MSAHALEVLLAAVAAEIGMADAGPVIATRAIEVQGFECSFEVPESDPDALYLLFDFGRHRGRTLRLFTAMLEANLTTYAQDQAQLGIDSETGVVILIVRIPGLHDIDPGWLADTLLHYSEHGLYWRDTIFRASDEMFDAVSRGDFEWIRA